MIQPEQSLTNSDRRWTPRFLQEIEELGNTVGFVDAIHQTLQQGHVTVDVEGDFDQLQDHSGGILFVGDHKNQWEFIALTDILSQMGRTDMLNIAKFYVQREVYLSLGHVAAEQHALPVYPRILARDRANPLNYEIANRVIFRHYLLTLAESEEANTRSLGIASEKLVEGGTVNIHPTGRVVDARTHPWRAGVGRIIQHISEETRKDILIAPYSLDKISNVQLLGALAVRGRGVLGRPQTMHVQLGPLQTAAALVDSLPDSDRDDPVAITTQLQRQFVAHFGNTE